MPPSNAQISIAGAMLITLASIKPLKIVFATAVPDSAPNKFIEAAKMIAWLGVNTFVWSFRNRGREVPGPAPRVVLEAPSGARWEWNREVESDFVEGRATEFCQVVAQTRAWEDTSLRAVGDVARQWMSIAQCFAGPPEDPPRSGTRNLTRPD